MLIWGHCCGHHAIECEVEEGEVHEEQVPQNFSHSPLKSNHCINYNAIDHSLQENIWELNHNLQYKIKVREKVNISDKLYSENLVVKLLDSQ